jgi:hypothetical protein
MKRITVLLVLACAAGAALAGDQDFILVNETGLTIDQFYCSPTTVAEWQEDVLGKDVLKDGQKAEIRFSRDEEACAWDLLIVDEDGDKIVWNDIDLCEAETITLYYEGNKPTALITPAEAEDEDESPVEDEEDEEEE